MGLPAPAAQPGEAFPMGPQNQHGSTAGGSNLLYYLQSRSSQAFCKFSWKSFHFCTLIQCGTELRNAQKVYECIPEGKGGRVARVPTVCAGAPPLLKSFQTARRAGREGGEGACLGEHRAAWDAVPSELKMRRTSSFLFASCSNTRAL